MRPIDFPQSSKVLRRPGTMSDRECQSLPVWSDGKQYVSCWRPSIKERFHVMFGGDVWLGVMSGKTQPPVFVAGERVFRKTPFLAHLRAFYISMGEVIAGICKSLAEAAKTHNKRKHYKVGVAIGLIVGVIPAFYVGLAWGALIGFIAGCISGAIKEWWDSNGHGTVELMDFIFTAMGAASGACISVPVMMLLRLILQL